ncbi:10136_t:CDS:2 [Cetraspora pellucida]|uniref:10136_t:CDS:1 n=1 Tax=Cetraspora pellucida TaxID=1433469 RepID=A0A9N9HN74_9GLOM|nr:10136_t:CDS:2 [Cetraspora pellucida]
MSDIESEETSQTENLLEVNDVLEKDNFQTEDSQTNLKKHKQHHKTNKQPALCWKYFKVEEEESSNTKGSQQTITSILQCVVLHKGIKKLNICHAVAEWLLMLYSYTGHAIKEFLINKAQEFNLQNKILCIVTDNGNNIVRAIRNWESVERLSCTAHILQLSINHAFKPQCQQIIHIQNLKKMFCNNSNSSDESENNSNFEDEKGNEIIANNQITINKLIELHPAIRQLSVTLPLDDDPDAQKDGQKLNKLILQDNEWDFVKRLIEILELFNSATEYFSAERYCIIVYIHLLMKAIKVYYAKNIDPNEYDYNNAEGLQKTSNYDLESDSSDNKNESNISFDTQENQSENDPELIDYPSQICLLVTLLDPWLKEMTFANEETRNNTINECDLIFSNAQRSQEFTDELDFYLDFRQTPLAFSDADSLL